MPFETRHDLSLPDAARRRCLDRADTVGFIRRLPDRLLASFESTLAEVVEASLLVFVVDASDHERELHLRTTREIVDKIGAGGLPRFYVFKKPRSPAGGP